MDKLFLIACFLIPFENFWFAPSSGWATIAPIIFFVYVMLNFKYAIRSLEKNSFLMVILIYGLLVTLVNYLFMEAEIANLIDTLISVVLGMTFYIALDIYFVQKRKKISSIVFCLVFAYSLAILMGVIEFFAFRLHLTDILNLIVSSQKRSYLVNGRVQFTFTEPSFIGMHIYGVLLPVYIFSKDKRIRNIMILFVISAILIGSGIRIIVDTIAFLGINFIYKMEFKKVKNIIILLFILISTVIGGMYIYNSNYRFRVIVNRGIYADGSFASRWFRINASLKGYKIDKMHSLVGYGYGNAIIPLRKGIPDAKKEYKNSYMREVRELSDSAYNSDSVAYCLYIRLVSELGFLFYIGVILFFIKYWKYITDTNVRSYFFIVCYLYIQFDSYAFYALWILILLMKNGRNTSLNYEGN